VWPAVPTIPTLAGLVVIVAVLATVTVTSLRATRGGPTAAPEEEDPAPALARGESQR
jgi:hypothetical protein